MKVISKYNTAATANACTHQKQQIFEITRHISRLYLQYKFHVRDLYEHIFNEQFCPMARLNNNNFFFMSGRSKIIVKSPNKTTSLLTTSGYVL